ncbi:PAS domain-containing protein [Planctomicrobium sp. SH661]|uniref:PAS domain-containing protein n=1 Tax=Planctomicrobium sp. SH661 TaxID=3448124 RepID=UPI003F5B6196
MSSSQILLDHESPAETLVIPDGNGPEFDCNFRILCDRSLAEIYVYQNALLKYASAAMADLLNRPLAAIIGAPAFQFVHPDDQEHVEEQIRQRDATHPCRMSFQMKTAEVSMRQKVQRDSLLAKHESPVLKCA